MEPKNFIKLNKWKKIEAGDLAAQKKDVYQIQCLSVKQNVSKKCNTANKNA
jgi:hypothetical protein